MPASSPPSPLKNIYYKWKSLPLPWRRQRLVGADLAGNTYWEFKDKLNSNRFRRIMKHASRRNLYAQGNAAFADVKISPQWHQWLRHTRPEPPTIQEQQFEISRQAMMKQLAAQADERWRSVPSFLDKPAVMGKAEPAIAGAPAAEAGAGTSAKLEEENEGGSGVISQVEETREGAESGRKGGGKKEPAPWDAVDRGAPSENFQPQAWTPGVAQRRR
ncbi:hypothetical protein K431DRAFT_228054 [Polychaeton citri CBS 116435]|uniref:NADH dehydrogenase [ubiquinone] 1 alpha subcomplex subunit n=1 Tax=Polychaeton citri CBS 116435 TaxID=1314669 RepID=A0A9P4UL18_9PEZI|nr:hypothetical protein K431DRAFT_228054 [Polychaeton citri CBS 116435]